MSLDNIETMNLEQLKKKLEQVKEWRYQDAMSDDYAYSNGKDARWKRIEMEIRNRIFTLESA
jgi:hypothetical protein